MRSLVLKQDVATMYRGYVAKQRDKMPGKQPIGRTLFYSIAKHITGGGRLQEARAGVDYIKVNFHTDNFTIIDKVIVLAHLCLKSTIPCVVSYVGSAPMYTASLVMATQYMQS